MSEMENETVKGIVEELFPNLLFRIRLEDGEETMAYLAGKMRLHKIRVLVGDTVELVIDKYGGKARIVKRL